VSRLHDNNGNCNVNDYQSNSVCCMVLQCVAVCDVTKY